MVVGVESITGTPHDSKTLSVALDSIRRMFVKEFSRVIVDRNYRIHEQVGASEVILPGSCISKSAYARCRHKFRYRHRSRDRGGGRAFKMGT